MFDKLKSSSEEDDQCHVSANRFLRHAPHRKTRLSRVPRLYGQDGIANSQQRKKPNRYLSDNEYRYFSTLEVIFVRGDLEMEAIGAIFLYQLGE